ncbi:uncharacterized protein LOC127285483 [Leptopilina boulardi]|uniref:uncharacterized protein LOC127285483 n=1 Tax=Leptopilina boulardi TaxID=63433 RepID=UPI0021F51337|nr:uncharacterized protein LOC127285483 [Leptopilina boulardi]
MYKIICLFIVYFAVGQGDDNRSIQVKWGKIYRGLSPLLTVKCNKNQTTITWNKSVSDKENALRATYEFNYISKNVTRYANSSNLCISAEKDSFEEVFQAFTLKTMAKADSCPIQKGTEVSYSIPFNYSYSITKSGGCGEFSATIKLFKKSHKTNLFPILTNKFGGNLVGC